jgi:hypothetical protein
MFWTLLYCMPDLIRLKTFTSVGHLHLEPEKLIDCTEKS